MTVAYGTDLARGNPKSCGCLNAERLFKHGMSRTRPHTIWKMMHQRCQNPNHKHYDRYGGRGIAIDPAWHDFNVFLADMGMPKANETLDRIDNDGPYCKSNCKWATRREQANNTPRNVLVTAFGKTQTLAQWGRELNISQDLIGNRIKLGWPAEEALTRSPSYANSAIRKKVG